MSFRKEITGAFLDGFRQPQELNQFMQAVEDNDLFAIVALAKRAHRDGQYVADFELDDFFVIESFLLAVKEGFHFFELIQAGKTFGIKCNTWDQGRAGAELALEIVVTAYVEMIRQSEEADRCYNMRRSTKTEMQSPNEHNDALGNTPPQSEMVALPQDLVPAKKVEKKVSFPTEEVRSSNQLGLNGKGKSEMIQPSLMKNLGETMILSTRGATPVVGVRPTKSVSSEPHVREEYPHPDSRLHLRAHGLSREAQRLQLSAISGGKTSPPGRTGLGREYKSGGSADSPE